MATFLDLQTNVRTNIIDLPTAVTTRVPALINRAIRSLENLHNFQVMRDTQAYVTVEGNATLGTLPADFKAMRGRPFLTRFSGQRKNLVWAGSVEDHIPAIDSDATGAPLVLALDNPSAAGDQGGTPNITVLPIPDGLSDYVDGDYRITLPHWKFLPDLSANGDTNWFTVNAEEWVEFTATSMGFAIDHDEERSLYWKQLAGEKLREVLSLDKRHSLMGIDTLVPHWQGGNDDNLTW